jgi:hypothetical protein
MFQLVLKHQFYGKHIQIYPCPAPQNSPMSTTQGAEHVKSLIANLLTLCDGLLS